MNDNGNGRERERRERGERDEETKKRDPDIFGSLLQCSDKRRATLTTDSTAGYGQW